ncbi:MAG TPA: ABC transporter ATP-binding protein [Usitatibacteraceae bacterium]|nr:ABC transporter ATP-binding protein [Usitatibacteraceae bacterium]
MNQTLSIDVRRKSIAGRDILTDVRIDARAGEITAVLGVSGCGKSTLLRLVNGLETEFDGRIALPHHEGAIGMVFQEPRLLPWLSVRDNVAFGLDAAGLHARADAVLDEVGLAHAAQLHPKQLSGGMAQRVAIARALVREPAVLLMDEPFSALDVLTRRKLHALTQEITRRHNAATLFVTHDPDEALDLAQRVVVLAPRHPAGPAGIALSFVPTHNPLARHQQRQEILRALQS